MNITKRVVSALVCIVIAGWALFTACTATPAKLEEEIPNNDGHVMMNIPDFVLNSNSLEL